MCYSAGTKEARSVFKQVFKQGNDMIKLYYSQGTVGAECQVDRGAKGLELGNELEHMVDVGGHWSLNWRSSWSNHDKGQTCGIS